MKNKKKEMMKLYKELNKDCNRDAKTCIREYLDKLAASDTDFGKKYEPKRFNECFSYVTDCAKELLNGKSGGVADTLCYKIATDFYNERLWNENDLDGSNEEETKVDGVFDIAKKKAEKYIKRSAMNSPENGQLDLFGGL